MIHKKIIQRGVIITFNVKSGDNTQRVKFFKQLYGWTQTVPGDHKTYEYHREGVLDEVPHKRIDQSAFIVPENDVGRIMEFFEQWHKKVIWNTFKVLLEDQSILEEFKKFRSQIIEEEEE